MDSDHLGELEAWGFETSLDSNGKPRVARPVTKGDILRVFPLYLEKEATQPPGEQVRKPALAKMKALHAELTEQLHLRDAAQSSREQLPPHLLCSSWHTSPRGSDM